eukprot:6189543-Pleurochrysis_carterae.AAC.2
MGVTVTHQRIGRLEPTSQCSESSHERRNSGPKEGKRSAAESMTLHDLVQNTESVTSSIMRELEQSCNLMIQGRVPANVRLHLLAVGTHPLVVRLESGGFLLARLELSLHG